MITLQGWALCSIVAVAVPLSPVLAFFMAIVAAALLGLLKDAGMAACLAIIVGSIIARLVVRRLRDAPSVNDISST